MYWSSIIIFTSQMFTNILDSEIFLEIEPSSLAYSLKNWTVFTVLKMETFICPFPTYQQDFCSPQFFKAHYLRYHDAIWTTFWSYEIEFKSFEMCSFSTSLPSWDSDCYFSLFAFCINFTINLLNQCSNQDTWLKSEVCLS